MGQAAPTAGAACAALAALAHEELALVEAGAYAELDSLNERRAALLDTLPPAASPLLSSADRALLRAAAATQQLAGEALRQRRDAIAGELGRTGHARRAAAGYAASARV